MNANYLAAEATHNPILPIWQEVVVGLIAFGLLCLVLMRYVFPQMEKTFAARVDAIEGGIKRAEVAQAEANQLLEQYRGRVARRRGPPARHGRTVHRRARGGRYRGRPALMPSGVGRESYADALDKLTADTSKATAEELATIADEILSVAGLLRAEPRLRRALTDPSRRGEERADLLRGLLSGQLSKVTMDTLATLVRGR